MIRAAGGDTGAARRWHAHLEAAGGYPAELAAHVDEQMKVQPWRHPECPIPLRPVILPSAVAAAIATAGREIVRLAVQECRRRAPEPAALAELLGVEAGPLLTDRPTWNAWAAAQARPDIVLSQGVPMVLECNIGSAIGGVEDTMRLDGIFGSSPAAAAAGRLTTGRTVPARRELLVGMGHSRGVAEPRIGITGFSAAQFAEVIAEAAAHGVECVYVELEDLTEDDGLRDADGLRIDVHLQKFIAAGAYRDGEPMAALEAAVAHDSTIIASPDLSSLQSNKRVLAWLTESAENLPTRDRDLVERHLPWTAVVQDTDVLHRGTWTGLLDLLVRNQDEMLIKPVDAFGGQDVIIGREVDSVTWHAAIANCVDGSHVAQEYHAADLLPVTAWDTASGELSSLDLPHVISPFVIDGRATGFLARFARPRQGGVMSAGAGGCNTVFVHD